MEKKITYNPNEIYYDGRGFGVVVRNEAAFKEKMKLMQKEVLEDLTKKEAEEFNTESAPWDKISDEEFEKWVTYQEKHKLLKSYENEIHPT
jgi:hypothetical protein